MTFPLGIRVTTPGLQLIKQWEGFRANAYPDPLHSWTVATIGYGTTIYSDGRRVSRGDSLTEVQATQELELYVLKRIHPALQKIPFVAEMTEPMLGALESFAYNLGEGFYGGTHFQTITRKLREKDWANLRQALLLYVNPGSSVEVGLRNRRNAEATLWETGLLESSIM
ncbi:MAG: lysozyme [Candidatus Sericytochromatia bacterium]